MRMRSFAVPAVYTVDQIKKTIAQMEEQKPEFVFLEDIYRPSNMMFANPTNGLLPVLAYVHGRYTPVARGRFLMALKRREGV